MLRRLIASRIAGRAKWLLIAGVAWIVGLAAALILLHNSGPSARATLHPPASGSPLSLDDALIDAADDPARVILAPSGSERPSSSSVIRFLAFGEFGAVLSGASIYCLRSPTRMFPTSPPMGITDEVGTVSVDRETIRDGNLVGLHPDYLPLAIKLPPAGDASGDPVTLQFERGETIRIFCHDPDGLPLEGVTVFLSQSTINNNEPLAEVAASQDWSTADPLVGIFTLQTDRNGIAERHGLAPGLFHTRFLSNTHEVVEPSSPRIELPAMEVSVEMSPMFCVVLRSPGGRFMYSKTRFRDQAVLISVRPSRINLTRLMNDLVLSNPGACVAVASTRHGLEGPWPTVDAEVRLYGHEPQSLVLVLNPVSDGCAVTEWRAEEAESPAEEWPSVVIRVFASTGQELSIPGLSLELKAHDPTLALPIQPGEPMTVPPGEYRISTRSRLLKNQYNPTSLVIDKAGMDFAVTLQADFRQCRFVFADESGASCGIGTLELVSHGIRQILPDREEFDTWLPVGKLEVVAQFPGYHTISGTHGVPLGDPLEPIEITLLATSKPK